MNKGTRIRTALAIVTAFYVALYKTDVTDFGNETVNLIYQIVMKIATFAVIFIVTYYNNDFTEEGAAGTGLTRQLKAEKKAGYIGDTFYDDVDEPTDLEEDEGGENEQENLETDGQ